MPITYIGENGEPILNPYQQRIATQQRRQLEDEIRSKYADWTEEEKRLALLQLKLRKISQKAPRALPVPGMACRRQSEWSRRLSTMPDFSSGGSMRSNSVFGLSTDLTKSIMPSAFVQSAPEHHPSGRQKAEAAVNRLYDPGYATEPTIDFSVVNANAWAEKDAPPRPRRVRRTTANFTEKAGEGKHTAQENQVEQNPAHRGGMSSAAVDNTGDSGATPARATPARPQSAPTFFAASRGLHNMKATKREPEVGTARSNATAPPSQNERRRRPHHTLSRPTSASRSRRGHPRDVSPRANRTITFLVDDRHRMRNRNPVYAFYKKQYGS